MYIETKGDDMCMIEFIALGFLLFAGIGLIFTGRTWIDIIKANNPSSVGKFDGDGKI